MAIDWNRYKTYDPDEEGYGNPKEWRSAFNQRMGVDEATEILKGGKKKPHEILGVSAMAGEAEIKKAFRQLMMKWHPDRNPGNQEEAEAMSKTIIAAYTIMTQ